MNAASSLRILHLEDDPDYCSLVKEMLEKEGWTVDVTLVQNQAEFSAALEKGHFDIVLADYSLPTCTGIDALEVARQKCPDTPFLVVSGAIGEQAVVDSLKSGATDYVLKQWPERLVPAVRRAVQEVRERTQRKLVESHLQLLNAALECAANGIVVTDRNGVITWVNPAFSELTGYSSEEVRGHKTNLLKSGTHPQEFYRNLWETILSGGVWRGEMVNRRKDGSLYTVESTITPVRNDRAEVTHFVAVAQDVTERKSAREALAESEERFRTLFELAPDAVYLYDLHGRFVDGNKAAEALVGYPRTELIGKSFLDLSLLSQPDLQKAAKALARSAQGESTGPEEYVLARKDGQPVPVEIRTFPIKLRDKALVLGIARDISERKRLEQGLADALRFNETVIAASSLGLLVYRASGECILANPAAASIIGASVEEVQRQNFRQLESWRKSGLLEAACRALAEGKESRVEARTVSTFGREFWVGCRLIPFSSVGRLHLLLILDDISARKLAEEALRESNRRQRSVLDTIADAAWLKDSEGRYLAVNNAWCRFAGRQAADVIGKTDFDVVPAKIARLFQEADLEVMRQRRQSRSEQLLNDIQGRSLCYETIIAPILKEDSQVVGTVGIARDITERKQLEAQLRQAQKMESIGQLAGGVAHDFNNLLAVMRGNADLLLMEAEQNPPQTNDCLKQIVAAAERAAGLTRQLLIFSRKQVMQSEPLRLNTLVADMVKMLKRLIREDIRLECVYAEQLPFVEADSGMLEQVLLNLVVNARDAMPNGGRLRIRTESASVDTPYALAHPEARSGEFITLRVSDTGTGIAQENLDRIFEPFFTTKEPGKGTGLGLATVYGIVKQHKGWIEVQSQVGKGTTFTVFLPAVPAPAKAVAGTGGVELRGGTETILLVEDDYAVRSITRRMLENFNYRVHEATCAREAFELWDRHTGEIALLLTDMVMPEGGTGRELAEQLRARKPGLKVILMSGYSAEVAGKDTQFFRHTGSHFLQKPCTTATLVQTVRKCLDAANEEKSESKNGQ